MPTKLLIHQKSKVVNFNIILQSSKVNTPTLNLNHSLKSKFLMGFPFYLFLVGLIEENSFKWTEPIRLQAVDRDYLRNGQVIYEIVDGEAWHESGL